MFLKFLSNHLISVVTVTIWVKGSKEPQCQAEIHSLSRQLGLAFWLNALFSLPTNLEETFIQMSTLLKLQVLLSWIFRLSLTIKPWILKPREHGCFYCSVHLPLWTFYLQASFPNSICILGRSLVSFLLVTPVPASAWHNEYCLVNGGWIKSRSIFRPQVRRP